METFAWTRSSRKWCGKQSGVHHSIDGSVEILFHSRAKAIAPSTTTTPNASATNSRLRRARRRLLRFGGGTNTEGRLGRSVCMADYPNPTMLSRDIQE